MTTAPPAPPTPPPAGPPPAPVTAPPPGPAPVAPPMFAGAGGSAPRLVGTEQPGARAAGSGHVGSGGPHAIDRYVDALVNLVLVVAGVAGLHHAYGGWDYLLIGAAGAALATGVVLLADRLRFDILVTTIALIVAVVVGSGVAVPDQAVVGVVPTLDTVTGLVSGLGRSWRALLTVPPPVGVANGLGVVPYILGFLGGAVGLIIARWTRTSVAPVVPGLAVLVAGILFGTAEAVSVPLQGGIPLVVALGWGAVRANRSRRSAGGPHWPRLGAGLLMIGIVAAAGVLIGPLLPLVGAERLHLREKHVPPTDPHQNPSPLAGFRGYLKDDVKDERFLTATGLPADGRVRLAAMDTYDGVVWGVGGIAGPETGRFDRVGDAILPVPDGVERHVDVQVERGTGMWVPTVGATRSVRFEGERAEALRTSFRYNRATRTGVAPGGVAAGDRFTLDAREPLTVDKTEARTRAAAGGRDLPALPELPEPITKKATELTLNAGSAYEKADALATALRDGTPQMKTFYRDGGAGTEATSSASRPGHSKGRLAAFLDAQGGLVGNAEQYAAAMAVMARWLGLPAQVVLGFRIIPPEPGAPGDPTKTSAPGQFHGRDIDAWVEIPFEGIGWVAFFPTPPKSRQPEDTPKTRRKELELRQQEPPPTTRLRVPEEFPQLVVKAPEPAEPDSNPFAIAGALLVAAVVASFPVLLVAGVLGSIVGAKGWRARRRRRRGPPVQRLAGAWWELCDRARDLGAPIPVRATRREVAAAIGPTWPGADRLAVAIDEAMFGAAPPADGVVNDVWAALAASRRAAVGGLGTGARLKAALSLASLRPGRWVRAPAAERRGADKAAAERPPGPSPAQPPPVPARPEGPDTTPMPPDRALAGAGAGDTVSRGG
jgi:transglutaminase-like putative cysteine protease